MERTRTEAERNLKEGGFLDVAHWKKDDAFQNALKKISEIMYNFEYKKRQPYCKNCAVKAVKQEIARLNENVIKKMENKESSVNLEFNIDYDKFGGADKFEKVNETEIVEDKLLDGMRQSTITGKYKNYICKTCSSHIDMEFKNSELDTEKIKSGKIPIQ